MPISTGHFIPAAGRHAFTPLFDVVAAALGVGAGFKGRVADAAALADGTRVLDLGCGTGVLARAIRQRSPRGLVAALDIDPDILRIARGRLVGDERTALLCASADAIPIGTASLDAVVSTLVIHHLPVALKRRAFAEVARALQPAGVFYLVDMGPRRRRPLTAEQEDSFKYAYRGNSSAAIGELLTQAGLTVTREKPPSGGLISPWLFAFRSVRRG